MYCAYTHLHTYTYTHTPTHTHTHTHTHFDALLCQLMSRVEIAKILTIQSCTHLKHVASDNLPFPHKLFTMLKNNIEGYRLNNNMMK